MQVKKIIAAALVVCLLFSLSIPAYAVDDDVPFDESIIEQPIYYTDGYLPGMYSGAGSVISFFGLRSVAYASYSSFGYIPTGFDITSSGGIRQWSFNDYTPVITTGSSSVSATTTIPASYFLSGDSLTVTIPSTSDAYFDFQSSDLLFDQTSADANTFYLNGSLKFKLSNLWVFDDGTGDSGDVSFYRASDPLAVQLLIDGKPYGDIVDVSSYTSPFTAVNVGYPATATVNFDNLKVYYQGVTPELIGFRVYTGSSFASSQHTYQEYNLMALQNLISFDWTQQPDITYAQENADSDYTGDLSGIGNSLGVMNTVLDAINSAVTGLYNAFYATTQSIYLSYDGSQATTDSRVSLTYLMRQGFLGLRALLTGPSGVEWFDLLHQELKKNNTTLSTFLAEFYIKANNIYLDYKGDQATTSANVSLGYVIRQGFLGLRALLIDPSGNEWFSTLSGNVTDQTSTVHQDLTSIFNELFAGAGSIYLSYDGSQATAESKVAIPFLLRQGFLGLRGLLTDSSGNEWLDGIYASLTSEFPVTYLGFSGEIFNSAQSVDLNFLARMGFMGLQALLTNSSGKEWLDIMSQQLDQLHDDLLTEEKAIFLGYNGNQFSTQHAENVTYIARQGFMGVKTLMDKQYAYLADTVFPWRSYNLDTHELNAATDVTGQNNLFYTAFQSMEDKLGRLAYVFGSDEDLKLKEESDPGTVAFRENFGGGLSLGQISDGADVVEGVSGLFNSGYSFGDAFTEISSEAGFFVWFTPECAAALDSTGSVMTLDDSDPYNMQLYYDHVQKVKEKREAGDD